MKHILGAVIGVILLGYPMAGFSSYFIQLRSGARFMTDRYWETDGQIQFNHAGGIIGFKKSMIKEVAYTDKPYQEIIIEYREPKKKVGLPPLRTGLKNEAKENDAAREDLEQRLYWAKMKLNKAIVKKNRAGVLASKKEIRELQNRLAEISPESQQEHNPAGSETR